jgi:hypothetical protein
MAAAFAGGRIVAHGRPGNGTGPGLAQNVQTISPTRTYHGVHFGVNAEVDPLNHIADVDNTGNSTGHHLHLQIMIDPSDSRTITYPLTWSETNSRNPELWIVPYIYGSDLTGTVVGKSTP